MRIRILVLCALGALALVRSAAADCIASITMTPSGTGGIHAELFGQGQCFAAGANGGAVRLLLSKDNGVNFTEVTNCVDGPCTFNVDTAASCGGLQQWKVKATGCSKNIDATHCGPDADDVAGDSLNLSHANNLSAGKASIGLTVDLKTAIGGVLKVHAPDAWTDRNIQYNWLLPDGAVSGGSQAVGSDQLDDVDVTYSLHSPVRGGTVIATLTSCSDIKSSAVLDAGDDHKCSGTGVPPECPDCTGRPIRLSNGNMVMAEVDPLPSLPGVPMRRTYDSLGIMPTWFARDGAPCSTGRSTSTAMSTTARGWCSGFRAQNAPSSAMRAGRPWCRCGPSAASMRRSPSTARAAPTRSTSPAATSKW
jgi:hypothetical protein